MHREPCNGRVKYWVSILVAALLCAGIVGCVTSGDRSNTQSPSASSTSAVETPFSPSASPTPSTSASKKPTVAPTPTPAPVDITPSMPIEVYIPSIKMKRTIHQDPCPIVNGKIDPDRSDYNVACAVKGDNLASTLPGTRTENTTMIVGHTWRAKPTWQESIGYAAFDALYNWETGKYTVKVGDEIWLRTRASGTRWLVYKITGFSEPTKTVGSDLWDFADSPQPNTLKLVGCQQPSDYAVHSTNNIVVKATFSRVQA